VRLGEYGIGQKAFSTCLAGKLRLNGAKRPLEVAK
jgi:hypothetical protein